MRAYPFCFSDNLSFIVYAIDIAAVAYGGEYEKRTDL